MCGKRVVLLLVYHTTYGETPGLRIYIHTSKRWKWSRNKPWYWYMIAGLADYHPRPKTRTHGIYRCLFCPGCLPWCRTVASIPSFASYVLYFTPYIRALPLCLFQVDDVRDTFRSILQMSLVLTYGGSVPVVKVSGRTHLLLFALKPCNH